MVRSCIKICIGAICVMLILGGQLPPSQAVTSRDVDVLPDNIMVQATSPFELEQRSPPGFNRDSPVSAPPANAPTGNPLWSIPLSGSLPPVIARFFRRPGGLLLKRLLVRSPNR